MRSLWRQSIEWGMRYAGLPPHVLTIEKTSARRGTATRWAGEPTRAGASPGSGIDHLWLVRGGEGETGRAS
jgi:hypothetical protein